MDFLTGSPAATSQASQSPAFIASLNVSSNLMSFNSPAIVGEKEKSSMLQPEKDNFLKKPANIDLETKVSPLISNPLDCPETSTPFEGDQSIPTFTFEKKLDGITEDPFDYLENMAMQNANDPFEMVSEKASVNSGSLSSGSYAYTMNAGFFESTTATGITAEFEELCISSGENSSRKLEDEKDESEREFKNVNPDDDWLGNEIPPWEKQDVPFDLLDDPLSDGEESLIDVRRVSSEFPKVIASVVEDLDTSIIKNLKLRSPLLKTVPELDLSPTAEPLQIPNIGLRSIDLSFMNSSKETEKSTTPTTETPNKADADTLDEWKKQIYEKATGFLKTKRQSTSIKPFSKPLGMIDVNSPSGPRVSTPVKNTSIPPKSSLPTPKYKSRLMKPRNYGTNKENV
ncbi:uncharacterized protein LOC132202369 isoform X2 [Neocloeon triangulifer]|uniref:uncharacterized protein LOC132202369 isoform X2 n=1 Tax=Neocloeon triangulifer TaxID=2078957 RepID=UPI00286FAA6C|nr:uncharacterized protein LOC132202369 isoform X2 [Neocloeon triangulifer]